MKRFLAVLSLFALLLPQLSLAVYNPTGGGTYRLQTSAGSADTTIRLSSFKEPVSNNAYTMAYMNTSVVCGTLDPQTTRSEFISFTGITQNSDGSAILTGVTRGLERSYPYAASTTFRQAHPAQSVFIISDAPCLFNQYGIKQNDETLTGYWNAPTPLSTDNIATKGYVDNLVNGGTVSNARVVVPGTAGETLAAGDIVALRKSDGEWYLADNDSPQLLIDSVLGVAQGAGTNGNAITGGVLLSGLDTNQSGLSAGQRYFISGTAGDLTTSTTTYMVGQSRTTTDLYVDFQQANPYYFNGVGYSYPNTQAAATSTALLNNGSGTLTWNGISQLGVSSSSPVFENSAASTTVFSANVPANAFSSNRVLRANVMGIGMNAAPTEILGVEVGFGGASTTVAQRWTNASGFIKANIEYVSIAESASVQRNILTVTMQSANSNSTTTTLIATSSSAFNSTQAQDLRIVMKNPGSGNVLSSFYGFMEMLGK